MWTWILLGWAVLATAAAVWLGRSAWVWSNMARGYLEAALHNKEAAEALEYEVALARAAVFAVPADPDSEGDLDIRA